MTELFLIRHGETPWTRAKRYQGSTDIPLNAKGRHQARATAKRLLARHPDILYTSTLKRSRETGEIIAQAFRKRPCVDPRINEIDFGSWEGKTAKELLRHRDRAFSHWVRGEWVTPTGGETKSAFRKRIAHFLRDVLKHHQGKKIAVVSHGGPIKMIIFELQKLSSLSLWALRVDPCSFSVVDVFPDFSQLVTLNDTAHLEGLK